MEVVELELDIGENFGSSSKLEEAVCNHGFFMMAPNEWNPLTKTLTRPLRLDDSITSAIVSVSHDGTNPNSLHVRIHPLHRHRPVSSSDCQAVLFLRRMLRISSKDENDVIEFQKMYPEAKTRGFGRLFRSPTLFEDTIKSLLLCACGIRRALEMAENLCKLQSKLTDGIIRGPPTPNSKDLNSNRKRGFKRKIATATTTTTTINSKKAPNLEFEMQNSDEKIGNFPSPKELASLDEDALNKQCNLGYRAAHILNFAKKVENGKIKLEKYEQEISSKKIFDSLMKINGFGPFVSVNVLMCLGFYQKVPVDSETMRHLRQVHGIEIHKKKTDKAIVEQIYDKYAPFQCLAYWFELMEYYESKFGKLSLLPKSSYSKVTGYLGNKQNVKNNSD
ncbi:hypothetical protein LguiB_008619 [Lonicera macranthoides]